MPGKTGAGAAEYAAATGRPQRIALVSEHYYPAIGGIEQHTAALARELRAHGLEVEIITTTPGPDTINSIPVHRVRVPLVPVVQVPWTPLGIQRLERLLNDRQYDVVHGQYSVVSPGVACAVWLAQRMRVRTVVTFQSVLRGYTLAFKAFDQIAAWTRWPVSYTAVSAPLARELQPLFGEVPVTVLPNAIEPSFWQTSPQRNGDGVIRLVSTMRLAPRKRPVPLLEALARARKLVPSANVQLTIVGDGPSRAAAERAASRLQLRDCVTFAGRCDHDTILELYARADAFVLASIVESFGVAALEARAAGLPVLAMRAAGISTFIRHEENGLLAHDDTDFTKQLARLIDVSALRDRLTRANAPVEFNWDRVVAQHIELYRRNA